MYSATRGLLPLHLINMFHLNSSIHTDNTDKKKIHQIGDKRNLCKFTVTTAGPLLWNALPTDLCVLPNLKFSVTDKKHLLLSSGTVNFYLPMLTQ